MFDAIYGLIESLVMNVLFGEEILQYVDQYFTQQTEVNQVLMVIGMGFLSVLGMISIIKGILKKTAGLIKIILLLAITYYVVVVVFNVDIWGMIFG